MYGRVTPNSILQGFDSLKGHLRGAYQTGRHYAGIFDSAVQGARKAYGVLKPILDSSATGKKISGVAGNALMSYDQLKGDVLSVHDRTHSTLGALRKAVPEIGL
jgi:tyrosyl-tRNA synthetase